jgi:hypothetical protein
VTKPKIKPKDKPHYVNNRQFSEAVVEYCERVDWCKKKGDPKPVVPNYVAECFLKIAEGLSHKANFVRYTYREEMVMDAVENCLKAIENYDIKTATRTGLPNAFAYFTQISWYAFLRRIPFVETLRYRIDQVKGADAEFKEYVNEQKKRKRRTVKVDSDLTDFLVDDKKPS